MDNIPLATAYPWTPSERPYGMMPRKRKLMGSGFAALQKGLYGTSAGAQSILLRLLNDAGVELDGDQPPLVQKLSLMSKRTKEVAPTMNVNEDQVLRLAQTGKWSLLGSILHVVDDASPQAVSAKQILRICALAVRPGDVPAQLDAKEMVLAAVNFLSSTSLDEEESKLLPPLPLILPLQDNPDLEKRYYEKEGNWVLSELVQSEQFQNLETLFCSSATPWEWLGREKFCPRLSSTPASTEEEPLLLLKGTVPSRATPAKVSRKGEGGGSRKRKTPVSTASSVLSVASNASGEPELEATLVVDDDESDHGGNSHPLF